MDVNRVKWTVCVGIAALWASTAQAALLEAPTGAEVAKALKATGGGWQAAEQGFGGTGPGTWTYALGGDASWKEYVVTCRVTLVEPGERTDGMEFGGFRWYDAMRDMGGYEAAIVVRHTSAERHYRVMLSAFHKEIVLWRPTGGVVQVQPFAFELGKPYLVSVACQGPRITVTVDDKPQIDWFDRADPVLAGGIGLGRKEGEAYFSGLSVEALSSLTQTPPVHKPNFRQVQWHGGRWFFDGKEPIFYQRMQGNGLDHMKMMPGYRASLMTNNFVKDIKRFRPYDIIKEEVLETGQRVVLEVDSVDKKKKSNITVHTRVTVTYDPRTGMYVYDHDGTVDVAPDEVGKIRHYFDMGNPCPLGVVGWAQTADPASHRPFFQWSVFQADDGHYYKVPLNHNAHFIGTSHSSGGPIKPDGGVWLVVGDPVVNPLVQVRGMSDRFSAVTGEHCPWAYDMHINHHLKKVDGRFPAGKYELKVRYTGMPAAEANRLLTQTAFYRPADIQYRTPLYTAGVGAVEKFDREVVLATPHTEYRLRCGVLDRSIGFDDSSSLRLDSASEAWVLTGPSYYMSPYGKRNRVTFRVKTRDVRGEGPTIGFRSLGGKCTVFYPTGITGTRDWTEVAFVTTEPFAHFGVHMIFRNSGTGTVWIDNFKIEALDEGAKPDAPIARPLPHKPKDASLVLRWNGDGDRIGLLDSSGHGHHGKVHGNPAWTGAGADRRLKLDGNTYVWPLASPKLMFAYPCTMVLDLKLDDGGYLIGWPTGCSILLEKRGTELTLLYMSSGGRAHSKAFLKLGQWQRLAIVGADDQLKLYVDGELKETLAAKPGRRNLWGYLGSTWHRHPSLFGSGPGDMKDYRDLRVRKCLKGEVGTVRVYSRALTDEEIAKLGRP